MPAHAGIGDSHCPRLGAAAAGGSAFRRSGSSGSGKAVKTGASLQWCHGFDLTKPMGSDYIASKGGRLVSPPLAHGRGRSHPRPLIAQKCRRNTQRGGRMAAARTPRDLGSG